MNLTSERALVIEHARVQVSIVEYSTWSMISLLARASWNLYA